MKLNLQELKHKISKTCLILIDKIVHFLKINKSSFFEYFVLLLILTFAIIIRINGLDFYSLDEDSFSIYTYSTTIYDHHNPYLRILTSDMIHNQKYPSYPPLYFYLGLIPLYFGYSSYPSWIFFMKIFFLIPVDFSIAILIFIILKKSPNTNPWFRVFAVYAWLVNRWALYIYTYALIDTFTIFFILLSLYYFYSQPEFSYFLLGVAIATKLFPILLLPLYLISHRPKRVYILLTYLFFAIMPFFLVSLPFIISSPEAYYRSMLFSATRHGDLKMRVIGPELMPFFGASGVNTRIPLIIAYLGFYCIHWKKAFNIYTFTTLGLLIWNLMNPNVYYQYWVWFIPFALILFGRIISTNASSDSNVEIPLSG